MHVSIPSVHPLSRGVEDQPSSLTGDDWDAWEEALVRLTDEIAEREGIPHEVAAVFAQRELSAVSEVTA